jgi:hypothetical protein
LLTLFVLASPFHLTADVPGFAPGVGLPGRRTPGSGFQFAISVEMAEVEAVMRDGLKNASVNAYANAF